MKRFITAVSLIIVSISAQADWSLNNQSSNLDFISIKKSVVGELHQFKTLSGSIKGNTATVSINLSSIDSRIPIRDERMKTMLFNIAEFATAEINTTVDATQLKGLAVGESVQQNQTMSLNLHGVKKELEVMVRITKLSNGAILISSARPIILSAADYGLDAGIEALKEVAKLPSINPVVPVTFSLMFEQ